MRKEMLKRRFYCLEPDISKVYTLQLLLKKVVFYRLTIFHKLIPLMKPH